MERNISAFFEELNKAIRLWAKMIDALLIADSVECVKLGLQLMELQPDAQRIDTALERTKQ